MDGLGRTVSVRGKQFYNWPLYYPELLATFTVTVLEKL